MNAKGSDVLISVFYDCTQLILSGVIPTASSLKMHGTTGQGNTK